MEALKKLEISVKELESLCLSSAIVNQLLYDRILVDIVNAFSDIGKERNMEYQYKADKWMKRAALASSIVKEKIK